MNIHFVCTGNTFRSRLAQAYLKSKGLKNINVSSSGTEAWKNLNGNVCAYTLELLKDSNLETFLSDTWNTTTKKILDNQDLVVFMTSNHLTSCQRELKYSGSNYLVWNIQDVTDPIGDSPKLIFEKIKNNIDKELLNTIPGVNLLKSKELNKQ